MLRAEHALLQLQAGSGDSAQDGCAAVASKRGLEDAGEFGVTIWDMLPSFAFGEF